MRKVLFFMVLFCCSQTGEAQPADPVFRLLTDRMNKASLASANTAIFVDSLLNNFAANGSWTDINYQDNSASQWRAAVHWERTLLLTKAYKSASSAFFNKPELRDKIVKAIGFWNKEKPVCSNYWWNAIGVPLRMGETFLLLENEVPKPQQQAGIMLMKLGIKPDFYDYHGIATGQNLVWLATVHIMTGLLENDKSTLKRAFDSIYEEIKITTDEGIQPDFSFHQHGAILYAGGYGLGFTRNIGLLMQLAEKTQFQFPAEKVNIFSSYVLDGQQWMIRGQTFDHSAVGREIARKLLPANNPSTGLVGLSGMLASLHVPRHNEFQAIANRIALKKEIPLQGNRHFPRSDFMTHHRKGYYSSVKMTSNRILSGESGNGENLKGFYLGHGVQLIYRSGEEYKNIFPVWDWRRLPGTLCEQTTEPLPLFNWGKGTSGATDFVGGVSDGTYGLTAYDYKSGNVSARKAWFHFDNEIACLGTAISCPTENPLFQSINQSHRKGDVFVSSDNRKMVLNGQESLPVNWVWHDSIAYIFPKKDQVTIKNDFQTGSWRGINNSEAYSEKELREPVFSLWKDFGKQVQNQSYYYLIRPAVSLKEMDKYENPIVLLRNDSLVQAVYHLVLKQTQAVFYQPGSLDNGNGLKINIDQPVLLILKNTSKNLVINLANPKNEALTVQVSINKKLDCESCTWDENKKVTVVKVNLPAGSEAGKSVQVRLSK